VTDAVKKQLRGKSLLPALAGEAVARPVFSETDYREYTYKRAVVTPDGWKLVYTLESQSRELFDLTADPGETRNLAATEAKRADAMQAQLFDHFAAIGHDLRVRRWQTGLNPVYPSQGKGKR
jgi:choline-sulfatase